MLAQDVISMPARFAKLQAELEKGRALLRFSPSSGRPARFLHATTGWGQFQAAQAGQLARSVALPELRELVLARHIVLYAHSETEVVMLAMRHERQLGYQLSGPGASH